MKKVFLEISQNSQENTCARVSGGTCNFIKKRNVNTITSEKTNELTTYKKNDKTTTQRDKDDSELGKRQSTNSSMVKKEVVL